jgi:hypothetical protein
MCIRSQVRMSCLYYLCLSKKNLASLQMDENTIDFLWFSLLYVPVELPCIQNWWHYLFNLLTDEFCWG